MRLCLSLMQRPTEVCVAVSLHVTLADAQYVIAREYGCRSWRDLKQRLFTTDVQLMMAN